MKFNISLLVAAFAIFHGVVATPVHVAIPIRKSVEIQQVQETNPVLAKRGFGQWIPQGPFGRTMFLLACISLVTHGMPMTWRNVYNNRLRKLQAAGEGDEDEIEDKPEKGYGLGEESVDRPV